ncbi:DUF1028 domain-containing protein [Bacillus sp. FJAT-49732]|uniref:DUF1028 domain-containing protein n=1 Tax=Lederbergia citrisecunda TaxID=2833583 RepID=A0A942TML7_9BACI|nr:DUF1028 domain-containing protein [Lederbergia citrisecunda]MBS4201015.1 DUF1028 domain-containing protein [Lederbergia citrisecunda]
MKNKVPQDYVNTYSIVGFDPKTKELGVAVASKFLSVGSIVPWAKAGVGAVATQSWANPLYGLEGLELMAEGKSAEEVVNILTEKDEQKLLRQVGMVDANGNSASFSGSECYEWAGGIAGENFACQGNILAGPEVVEAMAVTFQQTEGDLATRLLKALESGEEAGGDRRGKQSAALLVVKENGGYGGVTDRYLDLRVDDHKEPVKELERIFALHQLYFKKSNPEDILLVEGELKTKLSAALQKLNFIKVDQPTDDEILEALKDFHLIENFDERVQDKGKVDYKVVEYIDLLLQDEE